MKVLSGKENLSDSLLIDWDELLKYKGGKSRLEKKEKYFGKFILGLSVVGLIIVLTLHILFIGNPVNIFVQGNLLALSLWIFLLLLTYSVYLTRDYRVFDHRNRSIDLFRVQKMFGEEIYLNELFDDSLRKLIDWSYHQNSERNDVLLIQGILKDNETLEILKRLDLNISLFKDSIDNNEIPFDSLIKLLIINSYDVARYTSSTEIRIVHLFLALITKINKFQSILINQEVGESDISAVKLWIKNSQEVERYKRIWKKMSLLRVNRGSVNRSYTSVYSPTLEEYAVDITSQVASSPFQTMLGMQEALTSIIMNLSSNNNSSILLMGRPGIGKSKIINYLAIRMVVEDIPFQLKDKRLLSFDINNIYAHSNSPEEIKRIIVSMFEEANKTKDVILVFEDMDNLLSLRNEYSKEIVSVITDSLNKFRVKFIMTITEESYTRYIQPNSILASQFQSIHLNEPSMEVSLQILMDKIPEIEKRYSIDISFRAIKSILNLSKRVSYDTALPRSAIALAEEVFLAASIRDIQSIGSEFVSSYVSEKIGVNVGDVSLSESKRLLNLESHMRSRVIGQDAAISVTASSLRRSRAGLVRGSKPVASFLFYGPTGVGKTEVAKTLADSYFGDESAMIRLDMSEFQDENNIEKLLGCETNGVFSGGYLTEPVRTNPFSLVLLDEIEKANPKVLDLFLQILDEGYVTDGVGRKVSFTNSIIIATSNVGSSLIASMLEADNHSYEGVYEASQLSLRENYRVELLNRFDGIVMFKPLSPVEILEITKQRLRKVRSDLANKGIDFKVTSEFVTEIAELAYSPVFGARQINRVIQDHVENPIANLVLSGKLRSGGKVLFYGISNYSVN